MKREDGKGWVGLGIEGRSNYREAEGEEELGVIEEEMGFKKQRGSEEETGNEDLTQTIRSL